MVWRVDLLQGSSHLVIHHLHSLELPVENLLDGRRRRVALRKHGDDNVGDEPFIHPDFFHHLLGDLARQGVVAVGVVVRQPAVGRTQEILVLDIDEVLSVSDQLDVGLRDRAVDHPTFLGVEVAHHVAMKVCRVAGDGAEQLAVPGPGRVGQRGRGLGTNLTRAGYTADKVHHPHVHFIPALLGPSLGKVQQDIVCYRPLNLAVNVVPRLSWTYR